MNEFKSRKLDISLEKQVITTMITNTEFLQKVFSFIQTEYFTTTHMTSIADWVLDYYEQYELAPDKNIQGIFKRHELTMEDNDAEVYRSLLQNLSDSQVTDDNFDYLLSQTLQFCQKRELEITAGNIKHYLEHNDMQSAEEEILHFRKVTAAVSECVNVFDEDTVARVFREREQGVLQLPLYLGQFLGAWHRSWLVVFSGAYKRGKSWWLLDAYIHAMLDNKRVIFFSLEMTQDNILERLYHRVTGCAKESKESVIPVMDCLLNQNDTCTRMERPIQMGLYLDGVMPKFEDAEHGYRVCTSCREEENGMYQPAVWYERKQTDALTVGKAQNAAAQLTTFHGERAKLKTYPRFSANIQDIRHDLNTLEATVGFIPDVIIIDYADILKPESNNNQGTQKEDETWIALSQLAGERKALVITATQITKDGQTAKTMGIEHTARWSGKLGHVDAIYGINQTPDEKDKGLMRVNTLLHRHQDFNQAEQCVVLQNLDIGAVHLDSFHYREENENE